MTYYILLPGDTEADTINDSNILGEVSFKKFKSNDGMRILNTIVKSADLELFQQIRIYDSKGKKYSVEEFLSILEKLNNYK